MKRVIVLDKRSQRDYSVVLWAAVPAGREQVYADVDKNSAYDSASAAELTALRAGQVAEKVESIRRNPSWTDAQWKSQLESYAAQWQAEVDGYNPRDKYGTHWDGAKWTDDGAP